MKTKWVKEYCIECLGDIDDGIFDAIDGMVFSQEDGMNGKIRVTLEYVPPVPPPPISVTIKWGVDTTNGDNDVETYVFGTEKEYHAFMLGVAEGTGWMEYTVVEED